ncbi:MAG: class I SAM-dependent methyltransferase [Actinomycetota bacterium]
MTGDGSPAANTALWNAHADWWQQEFTGGVDPEYTEQIIPVIVEGLGGGGLVVDVGTGEGQVARALAATGCRVVGVDPIAGQVELAARRGGGPSYGRATADRLPLASGVADAAVACLVFEHIDAVDDAIAEIARVLRPGGRFLFLLNHPLLQTPGSGWIDDQIIEPPEQYWRIGPYLTEAETVEEVQKDVFIRFVHRPLSRYLNALIAAGLSLTAMQEPAPPPGFLAAAEHYRDAATIPRLLVLHLTKQS